MALRLVDPLSEAERGDEKQELADALDAMRRLLDHDIPGYLIRSLTATVELLERLNGRRS
jgi:hypothetical protein